MTRLEHPEANKIQQGAIFNCVVVPDYDNCKCSGIVLTARCDLEHNKHTVVNYLPVVEFKDWARRSLCSILAARMRHELQEAINAALVKKGVSTQIRETFPLVDVIQRETKGAEQAALLEKCEQLQLVSSVTPRSSSLCKEAKEILSIAGKKCDKVIEELIQHKLGEFYFLQATDVYSSSPEGYVVLLRNMRTMDCGLTERILAGTTSAEAQGFPEWQTHLTFALESICMVTGVLRSPDIEHLTQQFANLFVRVGLEDHTQSAIAEHIRMAKSL
jgi:hypothetical protein